MSEQLLTAQLDLIATFERTVIETCAEARRRVVADDGVAAATVMTGLASIVEMLTDDPGWTAALASVDQARSLMKLSDTQPYAHAVASEAMDTISRRALEMATKMHAANALLKRAVYAS